jgi:hypothetical protein
MFQTNIWPPFSRIIQIRNEIEAGVRHGWFFGLFLDPEEGGDMFL